MSRSTGSSAFIPAHPSGDRSLGRGGVGRELQLLFIEALLSTGRSTPGSWLVTINESKEVTNLSLHPSRKYAFYQDYPEVIGLDLQPFPVFFFPPSSHY